METLDITSICLSAITLLSLISTLIYRSVREEKRKDSNNDKHQWVVIEKMIDYYNSKMEAMCKSITDLFKRIKSLDSKVEEIKEN